MLSLPADSKKLARMEELLFMQEDIKRARAEFDEDETRFASGLHTRCIKSNAALSTHPAATLEEAARPSVPDAD